MSRLGIAFVLPYVGANGIKVVNNEITLDPNGVGELGALILNRTGVAGANGGILSIYQDVINENDNIDILNPSGNSVQYLNFLGIFAVNAIKTIKNNPFAPVITFDIAAIGDVQVTDSSLLATFDDNGTTLPYTNGQ